MAKQNGQPILENVTRAELVFLGGAFLAAAILSQMIYVRLFPDSVDYLTFARNILSGIHNNGNITLARYRRPPLYPHLVALFSSANSSPVYFVEVARQVSVFARALIVIPIYFLGREMLGKTAAVAAVLMAVTTPEFLYYSGAVLTESLATLFVCISMFILWKVSSRKKGKLLSLMLGFLLGLAFLTRHLVIGYLAIALVWLFISKLITYGSHGIAARIRKTVIPPLIVLGGFLVIVSPQVFYLHSETGKWALAMDPFSSSSMKVAHAGRDMRHTEIYEARGSLTQDREHYLWEMKSSDGLISTVMKQPGRYLRAYVVALLKGYLPDTYPLPYPAIILVLALLGMIGLLKQRKFKELLFYLWGFGGYYLFLAFFLNMRDRYMFPAYPFILLAGGAGVAMAARLPPYFFNEWAQKTRAPWAPKIILFVLIVAFLFPGSIDLIKKQNSLDNTESFARLGQHLSRKIEKNAIIFDRTPHLSFFSGAIKATPPYAEIEDVLYFARKRGVNYWIISSSYVPSLRPQYTLLLDPNKSHEGLTPVAVYRTSGDFIIVVYRIKSN